MRRLIATFLVTLFALPVCAGTTTYALLNHSDAAIAPPPYGLRLDGLALGQWTFDFQAAGSSMVMHVDDVTGDIRINGVVFGGRDVGGAYAAGSAGLWEVEFSYDGSDSTWGGGDVGNLLAGVDFGTTGNHSGTITSLNVDFDTVSVGEVFDLTSKGVNDLPPVFSIGTHRGEPLSGWGWLKVRGNYTASSDWLFTVLRGPDGAPRPVPEPGSFAVFAALSVAGLGIRRRRNG